MECSICLSIITDAFTLTCQHTFHKCCIDKWFQTSYTCPLCRHVCNFELDNLKKLIQEINDLSGFKIYTNETVVIPMCYYQKLILIKSELIKYKNYRSRGFSDDFLATKIGNMVDDINIEFRLMTIN